MKSESMEERWILWWCFSTSGTISASDMSSSLMVRRLGVLISCPFHSSGKEEERVVRLLMKEECSYLIDRLYSCWAGSLSMGCSCVDQMSRRYRSAINNLEWPSRCKHSRKRGRQGSSGNGL